MSDSLPISDPPNRVLTKANSATSSQSDDEPWDYTDTIAVIIVIILLIIFLIITVPLALAIIVLGSYLSAAFGLAASLLLLIFLLVTRILQLIRSGDEYETLSFYKHLIRTWLYIIPFMSLLGLALFIPIVRYAPPLKNVILVEVSLTKWIEIVIILCALCSFSSVLYISVIQIFNTFFTDGSKCNAGQAVTEIIDSLIFWWATNVLMKQVPSIKHHKILGLPTRNLIWVAVLVLISYNLLVLFTRMIVWLLRWAISKVRITSDNESDWKKALKMHFHVKYIVYFANGMVVSTCFLMSSMILVLTWVLYFGSHLDLKSASFRSIWDYGRWTFISLSICSFLWLIKNFILLLWEAHTVYNRLYRQISSKSEQLYFLGVLGSLKHTSNFFKLQLSADERADKRHHPGLLDLMFSSFGLSAASLSIPTSRLFAPLDPIASSGIFRKLLDRFAGSSKDEKILELPEVRTTVRNDLLIKDPSDATLDELQRATQYFFVAKEYLAEETYISDVLEYLPPSWYEILLTTRYYPRYFPSV